jgi:hypothetical protein
MKKTIIIIFLSFVSIYAQETDKKQRNVIKFLDIKVDNPELQKEVDIIKQEYLIELTSIKKKFRNKKKNLKNAYKFRLKELGVEAKKTKKNKSQKKL